MIEFFDLDSGIVTPRIKICGIRDAAMANVAIEAGASAVGFVFAEKSPRYISIEQANDIAAAVCNRATPFGVFCNHDVETIARWNYPVVQLHGEEPVEFVIELCRKRPDVYVLKGFEFNDEAVRMWNACDALNAMLIDGSPGGHGKAFQHEELAAMMPEITKPVILAGGLNSANVRDAIDVVKPFAVDVSSGVESSRGVKDAQMIREFCKAVRENPPSL